MYTAEIMKSVNIGDSEVREVIRKVGLKWWITHKITQLLYCLCKQKNTWCLVFENIVKTKV